MAVWLRLEDLKLNIIPNHANLITGGTLQDVGKYTVDKK